MASRNDYMRLLDVLENAKSDILRDDDYDYSLEMDVSSAIDTTYNLMISLKPNKYDFMRLIDYIDYAISRATSSEEHDYSSISCELETAKGMANRIMDDVVY